MLYCVQSLDIWALGITLYAFVFGHVSTRYF